MRLTRGRTLLHGQGCRPRYAGRLRPRLSRGPQQAHGVAGARQRPERHEAGVSGALVRAGDARRLTKGGPRPRRAAPNAGRHRPRTEEGTGHRPGRVCYTPGLAQGRPPGCDGRLAQLVEQLTLNQRVVGSRPTAPTITRLSRHKRAHCSGRGIGSGRCPRCRSRHRNRRGVDFALVAVRAGMPPGSLEDEQEATKLNRSRAVP